MQEDITSVDLFDSDDVEVLLIASTQLVDSQQTLQVTDNSQDMTCALRGLTLTG